MSSPFEKYRFLGSTGLKVSAIGLGTMTFGGGSSGRPGQTDESSSHALLDRYVDLGGNFIDTADIYPGTGGVTKESEVILGKWLKGRADLRESLIVASKVRFGSRNDDPFDEAFNGAGLTRKHILWSIDESLKRLQTRYIDLYQIHGWDAATPVEETFKTLDGLVKSGKVRYIGVSNVTGWQLQKICDTIKAFRLEPVVTLQSQYSLLARGLELELADVCANEGIGILPWSPLKGGLLTGKFGRQKDLPPDSRLTWIKSNPEKKTWACPLPDDFATEKNFALIDGLKEIAERHKSRPSMAQVSLRWTMQRPFVSSTIIGAKTKNQLEDNMGALDFELSVEDMQKLNDLSAFEIPYPYDMVDAFNSKRKRNGVLSKVQSSAVSP